MPNKTRKENNPRIGGSGGSRSKSNGDSATGNNGAAGDATAAVGGKLTMPVKVNSLGIVLLFILLSVKFLIAYFASGLLD